jgi:hypothetical protein
MVFEPAQLQLGCRSKGAMRMFDACAPPTSALEGARAEQVDLGLTRPHRDLFVPERVKRHPRERS